MNKETMDFFVALATILSSIAALAAVAATFVVFKGQKAISILIHNEQQNLSDKMSQSQEKLTKTIYQDQKLLSQRQIIIPLWKYLSKLEDIDPSNPVTPHVVSALNTLELVAICCEGGMIDQKVILRTFQDQFIKHYEAIKNCSVVNGYSPPKSGNDLLKENRAARLFYDKLIESEKNRDKLI